MILIKLGRSVLNLDRVACIKDLSTRDAGGNVTRGLYRLEFVGGHVEEVTAYHEELRGWLALNAQELTPTAPA